MLSKLTGITDEGALAYLTIILSSLLCLTIICVVDIIIKGN